MSEQQNEEQVPQTEDHDVREQVAGEETEPTGPTAVVRHDADTAGVPEDDEGIEVADDQSDEADVSGVEDDDGETDS